MESLPRPQETVALNPQFVQLVVESLPGLVRDLLVRESPGICVAGGYIRDFLRAQEPKDIDLFCTTQDRFDAATVWMDTHDLYRRETATTTTYQLEYPVQVIKNIYYRDHDDLIRSFDFTNCQAAVWYDGGWVGRCTPEFIEAVKTGTTSYTGPDRAETPAGSFLRMLKFLRRGWDVDQDSIAHVVGRMITRLDNLDLTSEEDAATAVKTAIRARGYINHAQPTVESQDIQPETYRLPTAA